MTNPLAKVWFTPTRGGSNWLWLSFFVVILDQATKALVISTVKLQDSISLLPILDIVYLENTGAAFSILAQASGWQRWFFITLAVVVQPDVDDLAAAHPCRSDGAGDWPVAGARRRARQCDRSRHARLRRRLHLFQLAHLGFLGVQYRRYRDLHRRRLSAHRCVPRERARPSPGGRHAANAE